MRLFLGKDEVTLELMRYGWAKVAIKSGHWTDLEGYNYETQIVPQELLVVTH